jgi:HSP20 family protein
MADVNVKKQSTETSDKALQKQETERGASRRGWEPFSFSLMPSDFFGTDPFSLMRRMHEEMDRSFSRFFGGQSGAEGRTWTPAIEVAERDGQLQIHADLPGLKPEDVKIEVKDNALVIQGERKYEHEENKGGMYRSERRYGQFYREIPLPEGTNPEQAKAQFNNGVLEVRIPVPEKKNNRRTIPIGTGSTDSSAAKAQTK